MSISILQQTLKQGIIHAVRCRARSSGHRAKLAAALIISCTAICAGAQKHLLAPTMSFTEEGDTMAGAPGLGYILNNGVLYVAYRAPGSNSLTIDWSTDGANLNGAVLYDGVTMGSDPTVTGDLYMGGLHGGIQVAYKSATDDTLWTCFAAIELSPFPNRPGSFQCTNYPTVHMIGTPSIADANENAYKGYLYIAYETSANDPNGANHLGIVQLGETSTSATNNNLLQNAVFPTLIAAPPSITGGVADPPPGETPIPSDTLRVVYQSYDSPNDLSIQAVDWNLQDYSTADTFSTPIVGTPTICGTPLVIQTDYIVPFISNGSGNNLGFATLYSTVGTTQPYQFQFTSYQSAQNSAQPSTTPAISCWEPSAGSYIYDNVVSVGFANSAGNLMLGTQQLQY